MRGLDAQLEQAIVGDASLIELLQLELERSEYWAATLSDALEMRTRQRDELIAKLEKIRAGLDDALDVVVRTGEYSPVWQLIDE